MLCKITKPDNTPFDIFWSNYPRRIAKGEARKAWAQKGCDRHFDQIIDALPRYIEYVQSQNWLAYAHPATWIRGERWDDEYSEPPKMLGQTAQFVEMAGKVGMQ